MSESKSDNVIPIGRTPDGPCLVCPVCGDNYIHPVQIDCSPYGKHGRGYVKVDADGIHLNQTASPSGRGALIALKFMCEQGHVFDYVLNFHKGTTFVNSEARDIVDGESFETIWRD